MICGIYGIKNKVNNKIYIGQSISIYNRWKKHKCELKCNKHKNSYLQNSYNKHGVDNFEFIIIEECKAEELNSREHYWIKSSSKIYNIEKEIMVGGTMSAETKAKLSIAKKGKNTGKDNPNYGNKYSQDTKMSMSLNKSKKLNKEKVLKIVEMLKSGLLHREISIIFNVNTSLISRISNGTLWSNVTGGIVIPVTYDNDKRILNESHKSHMRERKHSEETKKKMSEARKKRTGFKHSDETKQLMIEKALSRKEIV